jgi:hypothetical protein
MLGSSYFEVSVMISHFCSILEVDQIPNLGNKSLMDISPYLMTQAVNSQLANWEFFKSVLGTPRPLEDYECLAKHQLSYRFKASIKYSGLHRQDVSRTP